MPPKDYYVILGISPQESHGGVKSAFRDLARRYHPDRAGPQSTGRFQELAEAYHVLGHPHRRAAYDRSRLSEEPTARPGAPQRRAPVESLDPRWATARRHCPAPGADELWSLLEDLVAPRTLGDDVFHRFWEDFAGDRTLSSGHPDGLDLHLHLSPEEARWGGTVEIPVPISFACPRCRGTGHTGLLHPCPQCRSSGTLVREELVRLRIPSPVDDGTLLEIALRRSRSRNLTLRVWIRVEH